MDNIQVGIRVRPLLDREQDVKWSVKGNSIFPKHSSANSYSFDYVFSSSVETDEIYFSLAKPIILSVMEGFNGTIFVYGQTSSGKTHTMMGRPQHAGIIPLSIGGIFDYIESHPEREFIICTSYLEIYNETLTDLLNPTNGDLKIREDTEHNVTVQGVTVQAVTEPIDIARLLNIGENNRSVGETNMNDHSSRSHTIFTLTIESRLRDEEGGDGTVKVASLNLVDLAGSERVSATGAEGIRFKEGTFINKSLLVLGNVISKLSEGNNAHIPFRESKLTRILQSSLGGNAKTCIICTVTPAEVGETHSTLKFASRAKTIKNKPVVNEVLVGEEALLKKLKTYERENEHLRKRLEDGLPEQERQQLTEQLALKEKEKSDLEHQMKTLQDIIVKSTVTGNNSIPLGKAKANRRQTVCPSVLSRDVGLSSSPAISRAIFAVPKNPSTPVASNVLTPLLKKRVTFAGSPVLTCSPSPFQPRFDRHSFEKHLQELQQSPLVSRSESCRPSFIPHVTNSPMGISEDSLNSSTATTVDYDNTHRTTDAQVQTDELQDIEAHVSDAECQTVLETTPLPSPSPAHLLRRSCAGRPGLNDSLCVHKVERDEAHERIENMAFEADEMLIRWQELQNSKQSMAAEFEEERRCLSHEISDLKHQLQDLQTKLLRGTHSDDKLEEVRGEADGIRSELAQLKSQNSELRSELHELQDKNRDLEEDCRVLLEQNRDMKELVHRMEKETNEGKFQNETQTLQEKLAEVTSEASDIKDQLEQLKCQKSELESELVDQRDQNTDLQEKSRDLEEENRDLKELIDQMEKETNEAQWIEKEMEEKNQALQEKLEEMTGEAAAIRDQLEQIKMQNQTSQLEGELRGQQEKNKHLLEQNRDLQEQNKALEEHDKFVVSESKDLQEKNKHLLEQNRDLQEQNKALEEHDKFVVLESKDLQEKNKHLLEQNRDLQEQNRDLQEQNKALEEHDKSVLLESKDLQEKNEHLREQNKDLLQQSNDLLAQNNELEEKSKDIQEKNKSLQEQIKDLEEEKRELNEIIADTEKEANEAQWNESELDRKNQELQSKLAEVTYEAGAVRNQLEQLKGQRSEFQSRLCEVQEKNGRLQEEMKEIEEENRDLKELVDLTEKERNDAQWIEKELDEKYQALQKKFADVSGEANALRDQLEKLKGQMPEHSELEAELHQLKEENMELQELYETTDKEKREAEYYEVQWQEKCSTLEEQIRELQAELKHATASETELRETAPIPKEQESKQELDQKGKCLEDHIQELEAKLKSVTASESELQRTVERQRQQLSDPSKDVEELEETLKAVRRYNARLVKQIQGMAAVPKGPAEPVVDGSGAITGLAYYQLRIDKNLVDKKCESLEYKLDRLKAEYTLAKQRHDKEKEESKRYRHERNIYRTKYQAIKENCVCGIMEKFRNDPSLIPSSFSQHHADSSQHHPNSSQHHPNSSQQSLSLSQHCHSVARCSPEPGPAKTSPNPLNLPSSPEPYRQSVLSIKVPPDSNTANQKLSASTAKEKSVASAPVLKWNFDDKQESSGQNAPKIGTTTDPWSDENYWKNCDDGNRSPYFWERTFMNEPEEGVKKEQDSNCKTQ